MEAGLLARSICQLYHWQESLTYTIGARQRPWGGNWKRQKPRVPRASRHSIVKNVRQWTRRTASDVIRQQD
jgi:hypothetical protein